MSKPFDLEAFQAGDVAILGTIDPEECVFMERLGVVSSAPLRDSDDLVISSTRSGGRRNVSTVSATTLINCAVMKPKTWWVNFYKDETVQACVDRFNYDTRQEALNHAASASDAYIGTFEVED